MILYKSLTEDLAEILVLVRSSLRGPCMKILQMPCIWGACVKALVGGFWELLVSRSSKIRCSSSRSFHGDIVRFSLGSWHEDLGQGLVQVRVRRSYGHPSEMLSEALAWSCTGPCEKILKRSCWNPPLEVLALRSWRCSALELVWKFFWDAHRNFLYEDLLRSCKILYIEGPSFTIFWNSHKCPGMRICCGYEALMNRHSVASCAKTSSCCCSYDNV